MRLNLSVCATFGLCLMTVLFARPASASPTDACTLLTAKQVAEAAGVAVGAGTHVTKSFSKTCTWTPTSPSDVKAITLLLQTSKEYDGAKAKMESIAKLRPDLAKAIPISGLGDDAYFQAVGTMGMMMVKKGDTAIRVTVYGGSISKVESTEKALAQQALSKL